MTSTQIENPHGTVRLPEKGIAWRAVRIRRPLNEVKSAWSSAGIPGDATFNAAPGDRGTEVSVDLPEDAGDDVKHELSPHEGSSVAEQLESALRAFKATLEAGEIATITGQSSGRGRD